MVKPAASWVITLPDGQLIETFDHKTAQECESAGFKVVDILTHLNELNQEIPEKQNQTGTEHKPRSQ